MLKRLAMDPLNTVDAANGYVAVPLTMLNNAEVIHVWFSHDEAMPEVVVEGENLTFAQVYPQLARIFGWEQPLQKVYKHFQKTDLAPLAARYQGTPLVLDFDLYACLMKTIIHQQLNLSFAMTLTERFVQTYGSQKDGTWFYPAPETIASLEPEDLRALQFSRSKASYVIGVSQAVVEQSLDLQALHDKSNEDIMKQLTRYRGVGPWTGRCLLLFGLGRQDLLPANDIGIQRGLHTLLQTEKRPTALEVEAAGEQFAPYRSFASLYLWLSTEE